MPSITTACPTCKKPVPIPADDAPLGCFPFCCERCKLVDLGRWLDGAYKIPAVEEDDEPPVSMPDFEPRD